MRKQRNPDPGTPHDYDRGQAAGHAAGSVNVAEIDRDHAAGLDRIKLCNGWTIVITDDSDGNNDPNVKIIGIYAPGMWEAMGDAAHMIETTGQN